MTPTELKRIRKKNRLTQFALAVSLEVTPPTIANWESGRVPVSKAMAQLIRLKYTLGARKEEGAKPSYKPSYTVATKDGMQECGHNHRSFENAKTCLDDLKENNPEIWNAADILKDGKRPKNIALYYEDGEPAQ